MSTQTHALPPSATVNETEFEYVVELDVSDFALDELRVEVEGNEVTIVGEQQAAAEEAEEPFRLQERLEESFRLPADADVEWLTAVYEHGTLELRAPRLGSCPRGGRRIEITQGRHALANLEATPC